MRVQKRRVTSEKYHVVDYMVGGKWRSRTETAKLARAGKIDGVIAYRKNRSNYIQSAPNADCRLSDLPTVVIK